MTEHEITYADIRRKQKELDYKEYQKGMEVHDSPWADAVALVISLGLCVGALEAFAWVLHRLHMVFPHV